jgi:photosystem II stability/assembly factor-like uncharacterized protein
MKRILLVLCMILGISLLKAQNDETYFKYHRDWKGYALPEWAQLMYQEDPDVREVDYLYEEYYKKNLWVKDLHVRNYLHWRRKVRDWVNAEGKIRKPSPREEMESQLFLQSLRSEEPRKSSLWTSLGPVETYQPESLKPISFQANVYSIAQSKSHKDLLIAGTESGGIFKSENRGQDWTLMAADLNITSVKAVGIHPEQPEVQLAAANDKIFRSLDRGQTWQEVANIQGQGYEFLFVRGAEDKVYCASSTGLWTSFNQGANWQLEQNFRTWDIVQHPSQDHILYLLQIAPGTVSRHLFKKSENFGLSWTVMEQGWYQPEQGSQAHAGGGKIAVSPADPNRVYAALIGESKAGDDGWIGLYRSDNAGETWYLPVGQLGGPYQPANQTPWNIAAYSDGYHQGFYNFSLGVSAQDPNRIWIGTIRLTESRDGGFTFESIGAADSRRHALIHADVQCILVQEEEIWVATDGGIDYSTDELQSHVSLKKGIFASDYWGFGTGWNEDVLFGGKYHNGNGAYYQSYGKGNYLHVGGVEEATGYVNPLKNRQLYFNEWWAGRTGSVQIPLAIEGKVERLPSLPLIPNESYVESSSSGIYFNPLYAQHLYMGSEGGIWRSEDGGIQFQLLHNLGTGKVYEMVISRNNPLVMYAVYHEGGFWDGCDIYKTEDGGLHWERLERIPANRWRLEISLSPDNEQELWVATARGANGSKVFRTLDGGLSWENMSSELLNEQQMRDIIHQEGTTGLVYLATHRNVFYHDGQTWQILSEGLPFALNALSLSIFYRDNKLRLSTYGRGLWETELVEKSLPKALPMTATPNISCARDTLLLDSHSVIEQEGAVWTWEITPEPEWISDPVSRNPSLVLGKDGQYKVLLRVQNAEGLTDSREFPSFLSVESTCSMEEKTGFSLAMEQSGDYLQIQNLHYRGNTMTVMAWVKPHGIQNSYAAIFMNDGETAGFNFREDNLLGYHWPNGAWWWDSGLRVQEGEWNHVAMVVEPDGITLYLNGIGAKHVFSVPEVFFQSVKVGNYKGWWDRNMNGEVEELSIWDRALTEEEIRIRRHLLLEPQAVEKGLLSYYQFNEAVGRVNDRVGIAHGHLSAGANRVLSTAPVGKGKSQKAILDKNTLALALDSLGWRSQAKAMEASSVEVVITQLHTEPDQSTQDMVLPYWISNVYQSTSEPLYWEKIELLNPAYNSQNQTSALLQRRAENGFGPNWESLCSNAEQGPAVFLSFDKEACLNLSGSGQWILSGLESTTTEQKNRMYPKPSLVLYPNPLKSGQSLTIQNKGVQVGRLLLYSMEGKPMAIFPLGLGEQSTTPALPPGQYLWQWRGDLTIEHGILSIH